jgi:hypothetical protein
MELMNGCTLRRTIRLGSGGAALYSISFAVCSVYATTDMCKTTNLTYTSVLYEPHHPVSSPVLASSQELASAWNHHLTKTVLLDFHYSKL